jgi:hypothetical protein
MRTDPATAAPRRLLVCVVAAMSALVLGAAGFATTGPTGRAPSLERAATFSPRPALVESTEPFEPMSPATEMGPPGVNFANGMGPPRRQ